MQLYVFIWVGIAGLYADGDGIDRLKHKHDLESFKMDTIPKLITDMKNIKEGKQNDNTYLPAHSHGGFCRKLRKTNLGLANDRNFMMGLQYDYCTFTRNFMEFRWCVGLQCVLLSVLFFSCSLTHAGCW